MVVFGKKWFYSDKAVVFVKMFVIFGQSGGIRAKVAIFGQSGCIPAKVVVFEQK